VERYVYACKQQNIKSVSKETLTAICSRLATTKLILTEGKLDIFQKLQLNMELDDVLFALENDSFMQKILT
jgi:hypothetical protein